jgi:hypothetical protein
LNANSNPANALRQLDSTTRFRETKRPVLLDRVADENTGKRVKVEKTATGPEGSGAAGHKTFGRKYRDHEHKLF